MNTTEVPPLLSGYTLKSFCTVKLTHISPLGGNPGLPPPPCQYSVGSTSGSINSMLTELLKSTLPDTKISLEFDMGEIVQGIAPELVTKTGDEYSFAVPDVFATARRLKPSADAAEEPDTVTFVLEPGSPVYSSDDDDTINNRRLEEKKMDAKASGKIESGSCTATTSGMPKKLVCDLKYKVGGSIVIGFKGEAVLGYDQNGKDYLVRSSFGVQAALGGVPTGIVKTILEKVEKMIDIGQIIDNSLKGTVKLSTASINFPPKFADGKMMQIAKLKLNTLKGQGMCLDTLKDLDGVDPGLIDIAKAITDLTSVLGGAVCVKSDKLDASGEGFSINMAASASIFDPTKVNGWKIVTVLAAINPVMKLILKALEAVGVTDSFKTALNTFLAGLMPAQTGVEVDLGKTIAASLGRRLLTTRRGRSLAAGDMISADTGVFKLGSIGKSEIGAITPAKVTQPAVAKRAPFAAVAAATTGATTTTGTTTAATTGKTTAATSTGSTSTGTTTTGSTSTGTTTTGKTTSTTGTSTTTTTTTTTGTSASSTTAVKTKTETDTTTGTNGSPAPGNSSPAGAVVGILIVLIIIVLVGGVWWRYSKILEKSHRKTVAELLPPPRKSTISLAPPPGSNSDVLATAAGGEQGRTQSIDLDGLADNDTEVKTIDLEELPADDVDGTTDVKSAAGEEADQTAGTPSKRRVVASHDFVPSEGIQDGDDTVDNYISFKQGDIIHVTTEHSDGWWVGFVESPQPVVERKEGLFPSTLTSAAPSRIDRMVIKVGDKVAGAFTRLKEKKKSFIEERRLRAASRTEEKNAKDGETNGDDREEQPARMSNPVAHIRAPKDGETKAIDAEMEMVTVTGSHDGEEGKGEGGTNETTNETTHPVADSPSQVADSASGDQTQVADLRDGRTSSVAM